MLLMNSERFAMLLAESLKVGENRTVISDNIGNCSVYFQHHNHLFCLCLVIVAESVNAANTSSVTFPDPSSNFSANTSIFIPARFIQQRSIITGDIS